MNRINLGLVILVISAFTVLFSSCSEKEIKQGCTSSESINYDSEAEEDDGSCVFPADKLLGTWNATEYGQEGTINFPVEITRVDNINIQITAQRSYLPVYSSNLFNMEVDWHEMKLNGTGFSPSGTIVGENELNVSYTVGLNTGVYNVSIKYTR